MTKHKVHVTDKQDIIVTGGSTLYVSVTEDTPVPVNFHEGTATVVRNGEFLMKFRIPIGSEAKLSYDEPESTKVDG